MLDKRRFKDNMLGMLEKCKEIYLRKNKKSAYGSYAGKPTNVALMRDIMASYIHNNNN